MTFREGLILFYSYWNRPFYEIKPKFAESSCSFCHASYTLDLSVCLLAVWNKRISAIDVLDLFRVLTYPPLERSADDRLHVARMRVVAYSVM